MGSKFYGLKNKGKKRNKTVNETADLPAKVEINEALVAEQLAAPELSEAEVEDLFKRLNDEPVEQELEVPVKPEVKEKPIEPAVDTGQEFVAYGLCYNDKDKKFMKFEILYNPITKATRMGKIEHWADSSTTAMNKLGRIMSLKLLKREEKY